MIKGAVKLLIQQFFTALEEQLWQQQAAKKRAEEEIVIQTTTQRPASHIRRVNQRQTQPVSFLQRIVHLLRLGKGSASEEIRWTQRIRRTGYASMLLFLVLGGTRIIPRR